MFSQELERAQAYAELLATEGVLRGLIGPRETPRLWERHLLNCAVLGEAVPTGVTVCDVGSGAGLPGIALAIARPDLDVTLLEPLLRRSGFLAEAVERLELPRVQVVRARAEELRGRREFDVVTSRAVAPLGRLLEWSLPLVRPGGALVAMKGSSVRAEIDAASRQLRRLGAGTVEVLELGVGVVSPPTLVVRVEAGQRSGLGWAAAQTSGKKKGHSR